MEPDLTALSTHPVGEEKIRLPIRSQPVEFPSSSEQNILTEPLIQPISIGDFQ
jgi:hypothetical protein